MVRNQMMLTSNLASVLFMERNKIMAIKFSFSIFIQSRICCFSSLQNILGLIDCCERVFISNRAKKADYITKTLSNTKYIYFLFITITKMYIIQDTATILRQTCFVKVTLFCHRLPFIIHKQYCFIIYGFNVVGAINWL